MAPLTTDRITLTKLLGLKSHPVAVVKVIAGGMICANAAGFAAPAADTAGFRMLGVGKETVDNSAGVAGDLNVKVEVPILALLGATSITQAMVGDMMYVVDDQTFDDTKGTNGVKAGILVEYVSATEGWILIKEAGVGAVLADAGATYTAAEQNLINELKVVVNNL